MRSSVKLFSHLDYTFTTIDQISSELPPTDYTMLSDETRQLNETIVSQMNKVLDCLKEEIYSNTFTSAADNIMVQPPVFVTDSYIQEVNIKIFNPPTTDEGVILFKNSSLLVKPEKKPGKKSSGFLKRFFKKTNSSEDVSILPNRNHFPPTIIIHKDLSIEAGYGTSSDWKSIKTPKDCLQIGKEAEIKVVSDKGNLQILVNKVLKSGIINNFQATQPQQQYGIDCIGNIHTDHLFQGEIKNIRLYDNKDSHNPHITAFLTEVPEIDPRDLELLSNEQLSSIAKYIYENTRALEGQLDVSVESERRQTAKKKLEFSSDLLFRIESIFRNKKQERDLQDLAVQCKRQEEYITELYKNSEKKDVNLLKLQQQIIDQEMQHQLEKTELNKILQKKVRIIKKQRSQSKKEQFAYQSPNDSPGAAALVKSVGTPIQSVNTPVMGRDWNFPPPIIPTSSSPIPFRTSKIFNPSKIEKNEERVFVNHSLEGCESYSDSFDEEQVVQANPLVEQDQETIFEQNAIEEELPEMQNRAQHNKRQSLQKIPPLHVDTTTIKHRTISK